MSFPQNTFLFKDRETFTYWGNVQIGTVALFQFLSTMPTQFSVGENVSAAQFVKGQAIGRGPAATGYILADNSGLPTQAIGLACENSIVGSGAIVQLFGPFCLSDWTPIIGSVSLSARTTYYLDAVPGRLTAVAPAGPAIAQRMGYAISPQVLNLNLEFINTSSAPAGTMSLAGAFFFANCC